MKDLKSTNWQLIGFFGTKKPIICKIVDSVHSSVKLYFGDGPYSEVQPPEIVQIQQNNV